MHWYKTRKSELTAEEAARWELRYQVGAMVYAVALGVWCTVTLLSSDDAVAHMICVSVTTGYVAAGAGRTYGRPWIFHVQIALACGPTVIALAMRGTPYYIGMAVVSAVFFLALKQISTNLQRIFVQALVAREREAALAGQFDTALNNMPHGLCMFAADGRLAVMNHRFSEMMNLSDDLVQRRRKRVRYHRRLRQRRIDLGGERKDDPRGNREFAGQGYHHHRSRRWPAGGRCHGHSSRWPAAAPSCCWKTSPNGATPKPGSPIWRVTTN